MGLVVVVCGVRLVVEVGLVIGLFEGVRVGEICVSDSDESVISSLLGVGIDFAGAEGTEMGV